MGRAGDPFRAAAAVAVIAAFGERAQRWAAGTTVDEPVIAADESAFLEAIVAGVRRRMVGEDFAVALFLDEDPNRFVRAWGARLLDAANSGDDRRRVCAAIAGGTIVADGKQQLELGATTTDTVALGKALWALGERGVVVSEVSYARLATIFGRWHTRRIVPLQSDADVPVVRFEGEPEHLVIWAAGKQAAELAVTICAVEELHVPVYVVCDGDVPAPLHRCSVAQSAPLLASAAAILDANLDYPGTAIALARIGAPLAVARTSGAQEFLDGVAAYDGWNRDSILAAVLEALGKPPPSVRVVPAIASPQSNMTVRERAPLVTIVVPTYNRRALLTRALESVARQTYPTIETIVVNDAGDPVRDVGERFGATVIERATNGGHAAVLNDGVDRARGEYIGFLDDDDLFFPDHVASLVDALEIAHGSAAHANSLMALRGDPEEVVGFSPGSFAGVDVEDALVVCPLLGMLSAMIRRDVFGELGGFANDLAPNDDYEMILRIAQRFDWIHVDRITCLYSYGGNYAHMVDAAGLKYAELYDEVYRRHPHPDRPILAARRRQFVESLRAMGGVRLNTVAARLPRPMTLGAPEPSEAKAPAR